LLAGFLHILTGFGQHYGGAARMVEVGREESHPGHRVAQHRRGQFKQQYGVAPIRSLQKTLPGGIEGPSPGVLAVWWFDRAASRNAKERGDGPGRELRGVRHRRLGSKPAQTIALAMPPLRDKRNTLN
jgi:hypothetical protein